jgi:hypothetical protein
LVTGGGGAGTTGGATTGALVDIFLTGGGLFTFNSFQIASICNGDCSPAIVGGPDVQSVDFIGLKASATQYTLADQFTTTFFSFSTRNSGVGSGVQIDTLRLRINRAGTGRQILDNINLTPIPRVSEPSALLLLGSALASLGVGLSRLKKK